jgi:hypothetical protein
MVSLLSLSIEGISTCTLSSLSSDTPLRFTRGWTLQELIAPKIVEFYFREGDMLGTKEQLQSQISVITGIPHQALSGTPLAEFSVDERMAWATNRQTKRREDKAYCLLGIFDVSMPLIYGERDKALVRLREEIHKATAVQKHISYDSTGAHTQSYRPGGSQSTAEDKAIAQPLSHTDLRGAFGQESHPSNVARDGIDPRVAAAGLGAGGMLSLAGVNLLRERHWYPDASKSQPPSYEPRSDHHLGASSSPRMRGQPKYYTETGKLVDVYLGESANYSQVMGQDTTMLDSQDYDMDEQRSSRTDYTRDTSVSCDQIADKSMPVGYNEYFLPDAGIDWEVLQHEICRYLGNDATVRPCQRGGRGGYLVRAYRFFTAAMIEDLKIDSANWRKEQRQGRSTRSYADYAAHGGPDDHYDDRLLNAGSTWDYIPRSEQTRLNLTDFNLIDVEDVSERMKQMPRDDGHGPVFRGSGVQPAIAESGFVAANWSRPTDQQAQYRQLEQEYRQISYEKYHTENRRHQDALADLGQADRVVPPTINIEPAPLSRPAPSPPSQRYRPNIFQKYWQPLHDTSQAGNSVHQDALPDRGKADRFVPPTINIEPAPVSPP